MEAVILVGIQASGKSTFCRERYFDTHVRINLDMLKTRSREQLLLAACITAKQPFVVDNTNVTPEERAVYVCAAKEASFRVVGYYFASRLEECKQRNGARSPDRVVPVKGLLGTHGRLRLPRKEEGFDELNYVELNDGGGFTISEWQDEVR